MASAAIPCLLPAAVKLSLALFLASPMSAPVRLSHRVSDLFGLSRAEAEQFIQNGWVSVDGTVIEMPQHKVTTEHVELDPGARLDAVEPATILLHKPAGVDAIYGDRNASSLVTLATRWAEVSSNERLLRRHFPHLTSPLAGRRKMMQGWADYLDDLCAGGQVIAFKSKAS